MGRNSYSTGVSESHLPSTQKTYFLRVNPEVETAKEALESTLPDHTRDWERDLVAET